MRAYIYCSYKYSPVGFQMGAIEYNPSNVADYIPDNKSLNKSVVAAFEQGIVSKVYGLIPKSSRYVYLVKKLQKNNVNDVNEGEIDLYMNVAFEFDNFDDYKNFKANFDNLSLEEMADECAKFIVPDRSIKTYALKVKATEFNAFVKKMSTSVGSNINDDEKFYVEVVPSKPQEEKLQEIFNCAFDNLGAKKYSYPKKKVTITATDSTETKINPKKVAALVIIILLISLLILYLNKDKIHHLISTIVNVLST